MSECSTDDDYSYSTFGGRWESNALFTIRFHSSTHSTYEHRASIVAARRERIRTAAIRNRVSLLLE